jgi:hypothetical protein
MRRIVVLFAVSLLAVGAYLVVALAQNQEFGFPLDDAWIHQVYARNLGTRWEFSFFAGQPSAGSTSPLWAVWLGAGYALSIDFRVWAILSGIVFLAGAGWMAGRVTSHLSGDARVANWVAPLFLLLEWHMLWAAASGMEIVLLSLLALALVEGYFARRKPLWLGVLAGLLILTRPEGVLLAGLVGLGLLYERRGLLRAEGAGGEGERVRSLLELLVFGGAVILVIAPYLFFNLRTGGTLLPNTFYAKSAEYAELTAGTNFFLRWAAQYRQPLIGAQLLLLPGLCYAAYTLARVRAWGHLLPALWILLLPALYAWRLPVEYQFGRYMMPIIPFVVVYGLAGTGELLKKMPPLVRRTWAGTLGALLVVFGFLGATLYAQSVAIVNCEMVAVAKWTRANVPPGARIAAHDIGAQGYFGAHPLLDLAGLVSPEVIPFIRDEGRLEAWMLAHGAQYAVFFPSWYPAWSAGRSFEPVFSTDCKATRAMGEENLKVFRVGVEVK